MGRFLKTAERGKALTSLDETIRVGNSVVNDPEVHPKAFDWNAGFPKVFADGGFDVVVGNPPYIRQEWLTPFKPHWKKRFKSYYGTADIYVYFFELGIELLRKSGRFGFITSGSWVRGNFGAPLRAYLSEKVKAESIVDFGEFQPFEGAEMIRPSIAVFSKNKPAGRMSLFKWLTNGVPPTDLSSTISAAPTMKTDHLASATWELEPDDVLALREKLASAGTTLSEYTNGRILRGVVTGANDVFVIDPQQREYLISQHESSKAIIKPLLQGSQIRPWYYKNTNQYLVFTRRGINIKEYPAIKAYLNEHRARIEPRPNDWDSKKDGKWGGRKPGPYKWYEIQDAIDYWQDFEGSKILWPDISKRPRFTMDTEGHYLTNTGYVIPTDDYFLLGILSSWATWFFISKTAQPLRLRGDRWQYRLFGQYMENVPIPDAADSDRNVIAHLARSANDDGQEIYELQENVRRRLLDTFGENEDGMIEGKLNNKATAWWKCTMQQLGSSVKTSFKLDQSPFKNPNIAEQWETFLSERRQRIQVLGRSLAETEAEINDRVFRLFKLTAEEIKLLQHEVEH